MSASAGAPLVLRDERGQSLVFVVLSIGILVAILALVVDVGSWTRTQRRAQSVADAAALAAAQELPDQAAAGGEATSSAQQNSWSGPSQSIQSSFPDSATIDVVVQQTQVSGLLAPLARMFGIDIGAKASARAEPPATLAAVAPLALECQGSCQTVTDLPSTFTYSVTGRRRGGRDPAGSTLAPITRPGWGVTNGTFQRYVSCDATAPAGPDCNQNPAPSPATYDWLNRPAPVVDNAIQGGGPAPHLVAIFDGYDRVARTFHVVGWAVATLSVLNATAQQVWVQATFRKLVVDSSSMSSDGSGRNRPDFGVRAIALTG